MIPIHYGRGWPIKGWGFNGLAQRAMMPIYRKGSQLLAKARFDLVFFSTTEFFLHVLGPLWRRRFGVPFCMDYQDPWVNDYYREHPEVIPPGGRLKYGLSDSLHRAGERFVTPRCSGFLAVSQGYLETLTTRYGQAVTWQPRLVQPFPGEPNEFHHLDMPRETQQRQTSPRVLKYIGRGGEDMLAAARGFFAAWKHLIDHEALPRDALHFEAIGTAYCAGPAAVQTFVTLAAECGLDQSVTEQPLRLSYSDMLKSLVASDALVVFGSDDPTYTASKIYPYLLAQRPLLALFHRDSSVISVMADVGGGRCVTFDERGFSRESENKIVDFLRDFVSDDAGISLNRQRFESYTARAQAQRLVQWFANVIAASCAHPPGRS
jgi:hypothetical protein